MAGWSTNDKGTKSKEDVNKFPVAVNGNLQYVNNSTHYVFVLLRVSFSLVCQD